MSLIPYSPQEGREIVLRHENAIVVRDQTSQQLQLRTLTECPTCRRPLRRDGSPERSFDNSSNGANRESYVNPDYFRMLRATSRGPEASNQVSNPVRRFFTKPALTSGPRLPSGSAYVEDVADDDSGAEFISSSPGLSRGEGSRIRKEAFSPNYFKSFFKEERTLGKGGKGVVLLVRHEIDNVPLGYFACKRVPVGDDHAWLEKVLIEVGLLANLSHANLVSYRHVWLEDAQLTRFGPPVICAFILQQYCNAGDLHQYLVGSAPREITKEELKAQMRRRSKGEAEMPNGLYDSNPKLSLEEIYRLFKDITSGVAYLHAAGYIHRDLKPSNCLLHRESGKLTCLISDFGEVQHENVIRKSTGSTGTISYCAPEVLRMDASGRYENFTTKSDVFSLGMILYFMCFAKLPYRSANAIQEELEDIDMLRAEITGWQGLEDERRERPDLPPRLYKLLKQLLSLNPAERPSAEELLAVMQNDYSFERLDRSGSPGLGLRGNRIQSLDSPAPGTPVSDPRKTATFPRPKTPSQASQDLRQAKVRRNSNTETALAAPRRRPKRMLITEDVGVTDDETSPQSQHSGGRTPRPADGGAAGDPFEVVATTPRLLLPPPSGGALSQLRRRGAAGLARLLTLVGLDGEGVNHGFRVALLLLKMGLLAQPCWPYMTRLEVGLPLLLVATMDVRPPPPPPPHAGSAAVIWDRQHGHDLSSFRIRGFWTSMLLLVAHGVVVWMAAEWNSLCVADPRDEWAGW